MQNRLTDRFKHFDWLIQFFPQPIGMLIMRKAAALEFFFLVLTPVLFCQKFKWKQTFAAEIQKPNS